MVFNPARPEIATVTSEALQLKIRQLLPSQDGFGADLAAQNIIVPVVDLTQAAQGSDVPESLQTALAFGSQTAFSINNTSTTLINTTGFYRVFGNFNIATTTAAIQSGIFKLNDGVDDKIIFNAGKNSVVAFNSTYTGQYDFIVFLRSSDSLIGTATATCNLEGSTRQIADSNGTLVQPVGFDPQ